MKKTLTVLAFLLSLGLYAEGMGESAECHWANARNDSEAKVPSLVLSEETKDKSSEEKAVVKK